MKAVIATIQGAEIKLFIDPSGAEVVNFTADADIDCDGSGGNPFRDPCFQPSTRLQYKGFSLHAETVPYVVVPPVVIAKTRGIVMGCRCLVTNTANGKSCEAVVGDSGPTRKVGELSPAAAELLWMNGNPNHGGTSDHIINYQIYVGIPAFVNGVQYDLQRS